MSSLKALILLFIVSLGFAAIPLMVKADNFGVDATQQATGNLLPKSIAGASSVPDLIGKIIAIVLSLLGIVFFLLVFYAGILWMTARGNSETVQKAKDIMQAAIIGLVIVMASYAISKFVFTSLVSSVQTGSGGAASDDPAVVACRSKVLGDVCILNQKAGSCAPQGAAGSVLACLPSTPN